MFDGGYRTILGVMWEESPGQLGKRSSEVYSRYLPQGPRTTVPTMVFGGKEAPRFAFPHKDPLVVEMKTASAIVRRILIDTGSSVDIIT